MLWFCWSKPSIHGNLTSSSVSRPADLGPCLPSWAWHFRCYMTQIHPLNMQALKFGNWVSYVEISCDFKWKGHMGSITSGGEPWNPSNPMPQHEASDRGADYGPLTKWPMQAIRAEDGWKRWCPFGKNHGFWLVSCISRICIRLKSCKTHLFSNPMAHQFFIEFRGTHYDGTPILRSFP